MKQFICLLIFFLSNSTWSQDPRQDGTIEFFSIKDRLLVVKGDSVSIVDTLGNTVVPFYFLVGKYETVFGLDEVLYAGSNSLYRCVNKEGKMGAFTASGIQMFPFVYSNIVCYPFYPTFKGEDVFVFAVPDGQQWKLRTNENKPFGEDVSYDLIVNYWWRSKNLVVLQDGKVKSINVNDRTLIDALPDKTMGDYLTLHALSTNKYGLIRRNGDIRIPFDFDTLGRRTQWDSLLIIRKDGLEGKILPTGRILIPVEFKEIVELYDSDFFEIKQAFPPFLGRRNDLFEVLLYNPQKKCYESRSEPTFTTVKAQYIKGNPKMKMDVADKKGHPDVLVKNGRIIWKKEIRLDVDPN